MIVRNVLGHLGVEAFPRGFVGQSWTRLPTTTTHHDLHHRDFRGNYGLYFGWWDTLFGTEHPDYRRAFDLVTQRARGIEPPAAAPARRPDPGAPC